MTTQHEILTRDPEYRRLFAVEALIAAAADLIARLMAAQGVTKAELARRLGKSPAWVSQLLGGNANMTVRTLAEVAWTLGAEVRLDSHRTASASRRRHSPQVATSLTE
jgi:cyanate lyase